MEKNKGFSFYENFWTSIENLPVEQQKDVCYAIAKYGITGEMVSPLDNPIGSAMTQAFKMAIDNSVDKFNGSSDNGKKGGRPSAMESDALTLYLIENPKATAKEVGAHFNVSESAVQKRIEWKNRHNLQKPAVATFDF